MLRKDDVAFKKVVNAAMTDIYKSDRSIRSTRSGSEADPAKGINLNIPMSDRSRKCREPDRLRRPAAYK